MEADAAPTAAQPKSRRRWYQFSVRTLLLFVTLAGCGLGWLGFKVCVAHRQQAVVAAIQELDGQVIYDYELDTYGVWMLGASPQGPKWIYSLFGIDFFCNVQRVIFAAQPNVRVDRKPITDADLQILTDLPRLKELWFSCSGLTHPGWREYKNSTQLGSLDLHGTQITADGLRKLQEALPNCVVWLQ